MSIFRLLCLFALSPLWAQSVPEDSVQNTMHSIVKQTGQWIDCRDEQMYKTVEYGNGQTWMAENLNYAAEGSFCYDNMVENCQKYGRLYNWNIAVQDAAGSSRSSGAVQGVCPEGWHLPSDEEWQLFAGYLGEQEGESLAKTDYFSNVGAYLKAVQVQESWANNGKGGSFNILPGGYGENNEFFELGRFAGFWTSKGDYGSEDALSWWLLSSLPSLERDKESKKRALSIRCIMNDTLEHADNKCESAKSIGELLYKDRVSGVEFRNVMRGKVKPPAIHEIDVISGVEFRSADEIMRVVRGRNPGLRHAYNKYLLKKYLIKKPRFGGKLVLRLIIGADGKVIDVEVVESTTDFPEFDEAITKKLKRWKFKRIKSGTTVVQLPWVFRDSVLN